MQKSTKVFLILIFILALFLRFWKLDIYPEAPDEDELAAGYYGYSLTNAGTDEYGHKLPLYFESAGDYKYGLLFYLETIPVRIFGLNAAATRSVSALAGSLSVIAVFFLAVEVFKKEKYGLLSAFVLAVNPTHIHFSRVAYSNITGALLATLSILFYLKWIKGGGWRSCLASFAMFLLAIYTYQAERIFLPAVFILIPIFLYKHIYPKNIKKILFPIAAVLIVFLSFVPPVSRARSQNLSILIDQPMITEQLGEDGVGGGSILESRIFHNKLANFSLGLFNRLFSYYDPGFLFSEISVESQRHSTPGVGLLYLIEAPFILLGFLFLFKYVKDNTKYIPLILLFAAPLAAVAVLEPGSTTRAIFIVYSFSLITAMGIFAFLDILKKYRKFAISIIGLLYLANFLYFTHQYLIHKVYHHPWYSDVGLKEMVSDVNKFAGNYKSVVMSHGHYMPYLFYNKVKPSDFIKQSDFLTVAPPGGVPVARYGKIYFNMPYECPPAGKRDVLYVCFGYKVPSAAKLVDVIRYRDGQPALVLVEFVGDRKDPEKLPERVVYGTDADSRFPGGIIPDAYSSFWPIQ